MKYINATKGNCGDEMAWIRKNNKYPLKVTSSPFPKGITIPHNNIAVSVSDTDYFWFIHRTCRKKKWHGQFILIRLFSDDNKILEIILECADCKKRGKVKIGTAIKKHIRRITKR